MSKTKYEIDYARRRKLLLDINEKLIKYDRTLTPNETVRLDRANKIRQLLVELYQFNIAENPKKQVTK